MTFDEILMNVFVGNEICVYRRKTILFDKIDSRIEKNSALTTLS